MFKQVLFSLSLIVSVSSFAAELHLPGNRTTPAHMQKLQIYCESLPMTGFYHWKCCGTELDIIPSDYRQFHSECRGESAVRSCSRLCDGGAAKLYAYYSPNSTAEESVGATYICKCDNIIEGEKNAPPKP